MHADLPVSQLIQPGSRVLNMRCCLPGARAQLAAFRRWHLVNGRRRRARRRCRRCEPADRPGSRRAARFLALASLVAVLLCAVSIAMSARSYVRRHLDVVALMKTLGASRALVLAVSLWQLLVLAVGASVLGAAAGWLTQLWLVRVLRGLLRSDLPPGQAWPALIGFAVALAMLAGFALPSLLQLTRVPALRVLRRDVGPPTLRLWVAAAPVLLAIGGVVYGALGRDSLSLWFIAGLGRLRAGAGVGRARCSIGLARAYAAMPAPPGATGWRSSRAGGLSGLAQIVAFGLGITLLLALAILRSDLVTDWRASLPSGRAELFLRQHSRRRNARSFRATLASAGSAARSACCRWCAAGWSRSMDNRSAHRVRRPARPPLCRARAEPDLDRPSSAMTIASSRVNGGRRRITAGRWCRWRWSISDRLGLQARRSTADSTSPARA